MIINISVISLLINLQGVTVTAPPEANQKLVLKAQECRIIMNDQKRLECFDKLFATALNDVQKVPMPFVKNPGSEQAVVNPLPAVKAPAVQAPAVKAPAVVIPVPPADVPGADKASKELDAVSQFGGEHLEKDKKDDGKLAVVTFTIERVGLTIRKQQRFYFTNGQIWENKTSKELRVKTGDSVVIKDGALSAFYLSKVDGNRSVRVKRVK